MDWLFGVMAIFIEFPIVPAIIGLLLFGLGRLTHRRTATIVGVIWLLYSLYEFGMKQRWLCSGECNIRVDLLVIYPILLIILLVALISLLQRPGQPRSRA
jgi:Na+/proline symporter